MAREPVGSEDLSRAIELMVETRKWPKRLPTGSKEEAAAFKASGIKLPSLSRAERTSIKAPLLPELRIPDPVKGRRRKRDMSADKQVRTPTQLADIVQTIQ